MRKRFTIFLFCFITGVTGIYAQLPQYWVGAGQGSNTIPLSSGAGISTRCQFIYTPGEFGNVPAGRAITTIYFKPSGFSSAATFTNFRIDIGQSNITGLSASAWETGLTTALFAPTYNTPGTVQDVWIPIQLTTPIPYDPSRTLIIDLSYSAATGAGIPVRFQNSLPGRRQFSVFGAAAPTTHNPIRVDFGMDLINLPKANDDAGLSKLIMPSFCAGVEPVKVKLTNFGKNQLTNVMINWEVHNVVQAPVFWLGTLDSLGGILPYDTVITLGTINFPPDLFTEIKVWTSSPNGVQDGNINNDTIHDSIRPALSGVYTINNAPGADFSSVGVAVKMLNNYGVCGPVTFNVAASSVFTEEPIKLSCSGSASAPIIFQKAGSGSNPLIYGKTGKGSRDAIIAVQSSGYITFDGIDLADSVSNLTSIEQMEFGYAVMGALGQSGSHHNTIKNCMIRLNRTNTGSIGVAQLNLLPPSSLAEANHNNRYENIKVENSYGGIHLLGAQSFPDSNNVITATGGDSTVVGGPAPADIGGGTNVVTGINLQEQRNVEVSGCVVRHLAYGSTSISQGIWLNNTGASDYGTGKISGNKVYNIRRMTTTSANGAIGGIRIDLSATARAKVFNNMVFGLESVSSPATATANQIIKGIIYGQVTGSGEAEFYHNTVSIRSTTANISSSAFWKGSGTSATTLRNNIFSNTSAAQPVSKHYAIFFTAGGSLVTSNNLLWAENTNGILASVGGTDRLTLPQFAAAISPAAPSDGYETGSAFANPNFTTANHLTFAGATPARGSGIPISGFPILNDFNGSQRSTTAPTIGAIETNQLLVDSSAPVINNVTIVNGAFTSVSALVTDNGNYTQPGDIQLWYRPVNSGPFSSFAPDSTPLSGISGIYVWDNSLATLPVGMYDFFITARDQVGHGLNISVNPIQAVTFNGFSKTDPANYLANPDASVNVRSFLRQSPLAGGTYSVGASHAPFVNLTDVANALNNSEVSGNIVFELQQDYDGTSGETFPITFMPITNVGGNWSVTIRPAAGVLNRETSGYPSPGTPLISINGADRITFDGRPGGTGTTGAWTIRSKRAVSATSPCFVFSNGAEGNKLNWLKVESDNSTGTSAAVLFSTTMVNRPGNGRNEVLNSNISARTDSAGVLSNGIYSAGTAASPNDSITINNNRIFNWTTAGVNVTATGNGSGWQISNNSFYMTSAFSTAQTAIRFEAGGNAVSGIKGNYIGGSAANAGGTPWVNTGNIGWRGIVCSASITDTSFIENNTIQNISLTGGAGTYAGIEMTGAMVAIRNNVIGHNTVANSIQTSQLGTIISIWINNLNNRPLIENNLIANVSSTGTTTATGHNGIRVTLTATTEPMVIRNNIIHSLSAANSTTSTSTASIVGILSTSACNQQTIRHNTVYDLHNTSNAATHVFGINVGNTAGAGYIDGNKVNGLRNSSESSSSGICGIHLEFGTSWNVLNNMISLGYDVDSAAIITGINNKTIGTGHKVYHNTVLISGVAMSSASTNSFAFKRTTTGVNDIRNNIFMNTRTGGLGNYAVANTHNTPEVGWSADYNDLYAADPARVGLWVSNDLNASGWKTTSLHDTNSIDQLASFISNTDLHLTAPTLGSITFAGMPLQLVSHDLDGDLRDLTFPYMGADESLTHPLPVTLLSLEGHSYGNDVVLNWTTGSELNNKGFYVQRSADGQDFETISFVHGKGNSRTSCYYKNTDAGIFTDKGPDALYYRLLQVDMDGRENLSEVVTVRKGTQKTGLNLTAVPNPFNAEVALFFNGHSEGSYQIRITDMHGREVSSFIRNVSAGMNKVELDEMKKQAPGIYFITIEGADSGAIKVVKTR